MGINREKQGVYSILVIDDERDVAETLSCLLEQMGFRVKTAFSGRDGIDAFKGDSFDIVICDLRMPEISGRDVFDYMKRSGNLDEICFILSTGVIFDRDSTEMKFIEYIDAIIEKPFSASNIRSALTRCFTKSPLLK